LAVRARPGCPIAAIGRREAVVGDVRGAADARELLGMAVDLVLHLPSDVALHPLVRKTRAGDVVAQLLHALAVLGLATCPRMQNEAVDVGTQGLPQCSLARYRAAQGQCRVASGGAKGKLGCADSRYTRDGPR